MSPLTQINGSQFADAVRLSELPVLVGFHAEWCGPCRLMTPVLEQLATEFAGRAKIVKVNVDQEPGLTSQFGIDAVPTVVFFQAGQPVGKASGLLPEAGLRQALRKLTSARDQTPSPPLTLGQVAAQ